MSAITATTQPVPTSKVGRFIHRHPVASFLAMVYAFAWTIFLPPLLSESGIGVLPFEIPVAPFLLLAIVGVTLPVYIVIRVTRGPEGLHELRRRYTHWRVGIRWYLLAIFGPPIAILVGAAIWRGTGPLEAFAGRWELLFTVFLPAALMNAVLINLWEEGAWTGFLLPRLQERWSPLTSSVMVAMAWGLFHVPMTFFVGGLSDERIPPDRYWFYLTFLFVISAPVRAVVTWFWNSTRGSVIIVGLLHGAWNVTTTAKFIPEFVPGDNLWVWGVYAAIALIVIALTRGRLGYRGDPATRPVDAGRPYEESPSTA